MDGEVEEDDTTNMQRNNTEHGSSGSQSQAQAGMQPVQHNCPTSSPLSSPPHSSPAPAGPNDFWMTDISLFDPTLMWQSLPILFVFDDEDHILLDYFDQPVDVPYEFLPARPVALSVILRSRVPRKCRRPPI